MCVLQVCKRQPGWYSTNLAAAAAGLEEHSAGHADQITRVCVCIAVSLVFPPALLCLELRAVGWDDPVGYDVSLNLTKIHHVVYKSPKSIGCEDSLLKSMH